MASTPNETSLDMNYLYSLMAAINRANPDINSSLTWEWGASSRPSDCQSISIKMQKPNTSNSPPKLGNQMLSLNFQASLALFIGLSTIPPSLATVIFAVAVLISFAFSFAAVFLHNAYPGTALWLGKLSALVAAIGICIISSILVHQKLAWICWLACGSCLLAFIISFK